MKEKRKVMDEEKITGFFDSNTVIKGELSFRGAFRIDGHFEGKIFSEATLIIGDEGKVKADVEVANCIVRGELQGTLKAKEKIEIHDKGKVVGTLITPRLIVEEGAFLEARCLAGEGISSQAEGAE
jgi:cytoskeletal protein CcmA (bactofilin family)